MAALLSRWVGQLETGCARFQVCSPSQVFSSSYRSVLRFGVEKAGQDPAFVNAHDSDLRGHNFRVHDVSHPMAITGISMAAQMRPVSYPTEVAKLTYVECGRDTLHL